MYIGIKCKVFKHIYLSSVCVNTKYIHWWTKVDTHLAKIGGDRFSFLPYHFIVECQKSFCAFELHQLLLLAYKTDQAIV